MEAKELRIGNWVTDEFYASFKTHILVESIGKKGINLVIEDDGNWSEVAQRWIEPEYTFEKIHGIPLTPEILEKAGFERNRANEFIKSWELDRHLSISIYPTGIYPMIIQDSEFASGEAQVVGLNQIHYLHQLQNLYFALTGHELEINL